MPIKITWKSIVGLLSMVSGIITAVTVSPGTLPKSVDSVLIVIGGVIVAAERLADAKDYQTDSTNPPPPKPATLAEIQAAVNQGQTGVAS